MVSSQLPLPPFFNPDRIDSAWRVPYADRALRARGWAHGHAIAPASRDRSRVGLLLIDVQNTFCLPEFELYVAGRSGTGALDDNVRLCEFIYRNLGTITQTIATLDTHVAMQIFHPLFWCDRDGNHPTPATAQIGPEQIADGTWRVNPAIADNCPGWTLESLQAYALHYARHLAKVAKYPLTVWPYHGMLGGIGHALVSAVEEAVFFHSVARSSQAQYEIKGRYPLTENYSVLRPEVTEDQNGNVIATENRALIDQLLAFDALIVAGQAKSHCVAWTVADLLREIRERDPNLARKIYLLEDCTSPVVVPNAVDYTADADAAFQKFAEAGMHLVASTDAIATWPEFPDS